MSDWKANQAKKLAVLRRSQRRMSLRREFDLEIAASNAQVEGQGDGLYIVVADQDDLFAIVRRIVAHRLKRAC